MPIGPGCSLVHRNNEFWAAQGSNVYRSTNRGATWTISYTGNIGTLRHLDLVVVGPTTRGRAVSGIGGIASGLLTLTGVEENQESGIPTSFALDQNYPNPFNPSTTIKFALPQDATLILKIYTLLGQEVATLVDENRSAGYHQMQWNGRNQFGNQVATGVYFYRIEAKPANGGQPFTNLKKMLLLKQERTSSYPHQIESRPLQTGLCVFLPPIALRHAGTPAILFVQFLARIKLRGGEIVPLLNSRCTRSAHTSY